MDVARLNMSHGTYADHEEVYRLVREASDASGHGVGIFADLQGPKIRLGTSRTARSSSRGRRVHDHDPRHPGRRDDLLARRTTGCPATSSPATRS